MERFVPNTEKAREDREEAPKVPSSDPDLRERSRSCSGSTSRPTSPR